MVDALVMPCTCLYMATVLSELSKDSRSWHSALGLPEEPQTCIQLIQLVYPGASGPLRWV